MAAAWKSGNPSFKEWAANIEDPKLRNIASHARLCALAEKDPKAALAELYSAKLEKDGNLDRDVPREILTQLAKVDLIGVFNLMKDVEGIFAKPPRNPFADPSSEEPTANPFSHLNYGGDEVENSGVRHAVLNAAAENLPDDPAQLIAAMHKLSAEMGGGDVLWQCGVEGDMIRLKSARWSVDDCLAAAVLWAAESKATQGDATLQKLATRMARADPEQALTALPQFPEQARSSLVSEIIKQLPPSDSARRITLLSELSAAQWNEELGEALGGNAGDYAPIIAALPVETSIDARQAFVRKWGEQDPEAAAQWLESLPDDAASQSEAAGLAAAWIRYDADAATAWADGLPAGLARDGAADRIS